MESAVLPTLVSILTTGEGNVCLFSDAEVKVDTRSGEIFFPLLLYVKSDVDLMVAVNRFRLALKAGLRSKRIPNPWARSIREIPRTLMINFESLTKSVLNIFKYNGRQELN